MGKIATKVKELKQALREEGINPNIVIEVHYHYQEQLDLKKANEISKLLQQELGGERKLGSKDNTAWISNDGDWANRGIADFTVFFPKRREKDAS